MELTAEEKRMLVAGLDALIKARINYIHNTGAGEKDIRHVLDTIDKYRALGKRLQ